MARKSSCKKNTPKKTKKRSGKKISLKIQLLKVFAGLGVLLVLVIAAGLSVHYLMLRKQAVTPSHVAEKRIPPEPAFEKKPSPGKKAEQSTISQKKPSQKTLDQAFEKRVQPSEPDIKTAKIPSFKKPPVYEIFPEKEVPPPTPKVLTKPPGKIPSKDRPKIAIIIDDLGYDPLIAKKFIELEPNLTFAIIPHTPFQKKVAELVRNNGGELMLHIPMEPNEYPDIDPGPGALLTSMEPSELIAQLKENLETISDARGINGHMGSKLTASSEQMHHIFTVLKQRNLFFVDSLTTPDSVCKASAESLKVPFAQRDVFIDHFQDAKFMRNQIHRLIKTAKKNGGAIGIAHPHKATLDILQELMPEVKRQADLVPASQLVK